MECSTLSISANNGKVFVFLVKLYSGVFPPYQFQSYGELFKFVGLGEQLVIYWPPTGHIAVLYVCGDWSHCLVHCCILCVGTGHVA